MKSLKILTAILLLFTIFSCSNDEDQNFEQSENTRLLKKLVYQNASSIGELSEMQLFYNGSKIDKIKFISTNTSNNMEKIFSYDGDKIVKISNIYNNGITLPEISIITYNSQNQISKIETTRESDQFTRDEYEYISSNQIRVKKYHNYNNQLTLTDVGVFYLDSNENIYKVVETFNYTGDDLSEYNVTFDNKINPLKNITGFNAILGFDFTDDLSHCGSFGFNNATQIALTNVSNNNSFSFSTNLQYDNLGYPISGTITNSDISPEIVTCSYEYY